MSSYFSSRRGMWIILIFIVILVPEFSQAQVDSCPNCPDVGKRSLAVMIAERQGGTAQEWYDRLVDTTFVDEQVEKNVKSLIGIGTLFLPVGRVFGWGSKGVTKGSTKLLTQGRFPNFAKKFAKHSKEWSQWGSISRNEFYNRAVNLADSRVGGSIRGFTSKQGYIFRFNVKTGEFLTVHPNGTIQTFFRPKQGLDYYLKQIQLYGS